MSFFAKHILKFIFLLAAIILISGCNLIFNPSRYPDLHKVAVNMKSTEDSMQVLKMQKMKLLRALRVVEKAEELAWVNPFSIVMKSNTASYFGVFQKIENKTLSLKHKLSVASRIRKMIEKQNKLKDGTGAMLIVLTIIMIAIIITMIVLLKKTETTAGMGCLAWFFIIAMSIALIFLIVEFSS